MPGGMTIDEIYTLFPNLKLRRKSPGARLSGGEQQMLAIARILRTGAKLLLLDEPTEGLAPVIIEKIGQAIEMLRKRGFTILMVEQNFRFASGVGDRFYVIEEGRVVEEFNRQAIATDKARIEALLGV
jgi:branched-chain amino acid transport system ATP-binding protein